MSNNGRALKSGIWYTVANFMTKSIVFITTPIFTRLLSHEDFGLYNNFSSWLSILTVFVTLNLESTFISARFDFKHKFDEYIFSVLTLSSLSGIIWLILANVFPKQITSFVGINQVHLNMMLAYLLALPAVNLFQCRERYDFNYKCTIFISIAISIFSAGLSIGLVLILDNRLTGRIVGTVAPTIVIGLALYLYLAYKGKKVNISYWKYALPICMPFVPHLLSLTVLNSMDRVMITRFCGAEENALYSLAYTCGAIITLLMSSMNMAFSPWLGEKLYENKVSEIYTFSVKYILLFVTLTIGIVLLSPEILLFLGGESYQEAIYVMPPVAFGCVCQFLYTMYVNIEQFKKRTVGMACASVSAAFLNYFLNFILIPRYGYVAAAYTTLISYFWLLFVHMLLVKRLGYINAYPTKTIILVLGGMSLYTIVINFLYGLKLLRYVLIIFYVIAAILYICKNYKKLFVFLKRS